MGERIIYYENCPGCGAGVTGAVCPYCGTSTIRSRVYTESAKELREELKEQYRTEDAALEQLKGYTNKLSLFALLFGGIFFGVGVILGGVFTPLMFSFSEFHKQYWILPLIWCFAVIGALVLILGLKPSLKGKKILRKGKTVEAIVRDYRHTGVMINNEPELAILLRTKEEEPVLIKINTHETNPTYALGSIVKVKKYKDAYAMKLS